MIGDDDDTKVEALGHFAQALAHIFTGGSGEEAKAPKRRLSSYGGSSGRQTSRSTTTGGKKNKVCCRGKSALSALRKSGG